MGCCFSADIPNFEERLTTVGVHEEKSSESPQIPQTKNATKSGDIVPLLEGPEPLNFANFKFSSDSSSIEVDMERIEQLLKQESTDSDSSQNSEKNQEIFEEHHTPDSETD